MPSADDWETGWETVAHCQQGDLMANGFHTGRVCRKPVECKRVEECYFVAALRAHDVRVQQLDWILKGRQ